MKRPDSMDRKGFRGGLSAKGPVSIDRKEVVHNRGNGEDEDFL
jgi:hypothetical protein